MHNEATRPRDRGDAGALRLLPDAQRGDGAGLIASEQRLFIETVQQNLTELDPRLGDHVLAQDRFAVHDLTASVEDAVLQSGVGDGLAVVQLLHTSATLLVNEIDEPMFLADLLARARTLAPTEGAYLHNSPLRRVNLCADDHHCDRNGDAHLRASLIGQPSVTLAVSQGRLVRGRWQRIALVEFDGPRRREVVVRILGVPGRMS